MRTLLTPWMCAAAFAAPWPAPAQSVYLPSLGSGALSMPITSLRDARSQSTLQQKYDFSCGSAALATLLTYHYGYKVDEQSVFAEMFATGNQAKIRKEGFSLLDMKRYLAAHGFEADGFNQPLDKLAEARVPAIVLINDQGYHHFVVIKGLQGDRVLLGDPARGTRAMSRAEFEKKWFSKLLFVIHNKMQSARFNLQSDWRVAPRSPLAGGIDRSDMTHITLPKFGAGDF